LTSAVTTATSSPTPKPSAGPASTAAATTGLAAQMVVTSGWGEASCSEVSTSRDAAISADTTSTSATIIDQLLPQPRVCPSPENSVHTPMAMISAQLSARFVYCGAKASCTPTANT